MGEATRDQHGWISRRTFIGAAGAAGLIAATASRLPARAATATTSDAPAHCFFGANADAFIDIYNGTPMPGITCPAAGCAVIPVPGLMGVRHYGVKPETCTADQSDPDQCASPQQPANHLATAWPAYPLTGAAGPTPSVYSIYPVPDTVTNPDNPLYQETIAAITSIIASAPPNSYLNAWHEALSLNYPALGFPYITAPNMLALHTALLELVHSVNAQYQTNVQYGSIFGGGGNLTEGTSGSLWDSVPTNLDWYGLDVYGGRQNSGDTTCDNLDHLDTFINNAKQVTGCWVIESGPDPTFVAGYPKILICETNYNPYYGSAPPQGCIQKRADWLQAVAQRMHQYGANAVGILTFWRTEADLSGAYNPNELDLKNKRLADRINNIISTTLT